MKSPSVHDSQAMEQLLTRERRGTTALADSAYTGEDQETIYKKNIIL